MNRDIALLLTILDYINRIELYIDGYTIKDFSDDLKTYDATCMILQQIWECSLKLSEEICLEKIPIHYMRGLRNRITHDYMWLDDEKIWDTIKISIPELKNTIKELLKSFQ